MKQAQMLAYVKEAVAVAKEARADNDLVTFCAAVQLAAQLLQLARLWGNDDEETMRNGAV